METVTTIARLILDAITFGWLTLRRDHALAAENLFLRKQLAFYQERGTRPRRLDPATRVALVFLSKLFDWRDALVIVQPATLVRWHRRGFQLFWRWKSRLGRPRIPAELRRLIHNMALSNPSWGEERIANELLLKLGLRVSPRTVRKYMPQESSGPRGDQRWSTFVRNHSETIIACDFFVAVTATFRLLYVLIVIEHHSRRIVHFNVTEHPTAEWTLQQLREAIPSDHDYRFLIHDRDRIFSKQLDESIVRLGVRVLGTPYRSPQANAICERVIGTIRREALDYLIPLNEGHLRRLLKSWVAHYNGARPHMSLGPGVPDPPAEIPASLQRNRHRLAYALKVVTEPILGGLHHEYRLEYGVA